MQATDTRARFDEDDDMDAVRAAGMATVALEPARPGVPTIVGRSSAGAPGIAVIDTESVSTADAFPTASGGTEEATADGASPLPASDETGDPDPVDRSTFDAVMVPAYAPAAFVPVRGSGSRVWDREGREYVDFTGGIAVSSLGHRHPAVMDALHAQADLLWHLGNGYTNEPALKLARELVRRTFAERVFFCNSGAEANEAALKLARRHGSLQGTGRDGIIAFANAFHGRTLFTVSVGGQPKYTEGFAPLPGGIRHLPFDDLEAARAAISGRTCAVIVEPVQGEGGVMPASPAFLRGLRELCDEHGALLVFDEVQIGMGRSGSLYAYMEYGVTPDVLTTAKALGNGFPIGAMLTTARLAESLPVGSHGSTYGGNPLACAVARAVLETIDTPEVLDGVRARHARLRAGLERIGRETGAFARVRGMGLLMGAQLAATLAGRAKEVLRAAEAHGLMMLIAGPDVLRFAPSLVIPEEDLDAGLARLEAAVRDVLTAVA